jgi:hypothetical protein
MRTQFQINIETPDLHMAINETYLFACFFNDVVL